MRTHLVLLDAVDVPNGPANSGNEALHAWDDVPVRVGIGEGMDVMGIWSSRSANWSPVHGTGADVHWPCMCMGWGEDWGLEDEQKLSKPCA